MLRKVRVERSFRLCLSAPPNDAATSVALALGLPGNPEFSLVAVPVFKSVDNLTEQFFVFFGAPDSKIYRAGSGLGCLLRGGGLSRTLTAGQGCGQQEKGRKACGVKKGEKGGYQV